MICAGSPINSEGGMCASTRGGGLYCNGLFVGVASFGFGCGAQPSTPGVYTQVFLDSIFSFDQLFTGNYQYKLLSKGSNV